MRLRERERGKWREGKGREGRRAERRGEEKEEKRREEKRREEKRREEKRNLREKHQLVASICTPTRDRTCNLGMCPNQELNPQLFGIQDDTPNN